MARRRAVDGYEDWYFVEDYTALGVLNEAAVGHGHRTPHDALARRFGSGAGGLYGLVEGSAPARRRARPSGWRVRRGSERRPLGELLGDGMDPAEAGLWRRQLVFGPGPGVLLARSRTVCGRRRDSPAGGVDGDLDYARAPHEFVRSYTRLLVATGVRVGLTTGERRGTVQWQRLAPGFHRRTPGHLTYSPGLLTRRPLNVDERGPAT